MEINKRTLYDRVLYSIEECKSVWYGELKSINMNNNTKCFLTQEFNKMNYTNRTYIKDITTLFGLKIVENNNLENRELEIILEKIEKEMEDGFIARYEKAYRFTIE